MLTHFKAQLIHKKHLAADIWEFRFKPEAPVSFRAGEYMILKVGEKRRLYSVSSSDHSPEYFELLVQILPQGVGSDFLRQLPEGEFAEFMGPAGQFFLRTMDKPKIFLATGTGIAPMKSQLSHLCKELEAIEEAHLAPQIILFWGMKTQSDMYYLEFFQELSKKYSNFTFYICLTRELNKHVFDTPYIKEGRVLDVMMRYFEGKLPLSNEFEYIVCGGKEMVASTVEQLLEKGVEKTHIYFEKFTT